MRKTIINPAVEYSLPVALSFLDLELLALVEFTSECPEHPVESALSLTAEPGAGWQAAVIGEQVIRLVFDQPQAIEHVLLVFDELQQARTQEFALFELSDGETGYREILRQQYHFSPPQTTREVEHYEISLKQLKALELRIMPDIDGGAAYATLKQLRLA